VSALCPSASGLASHLWREKERLNHSFRTWGGQQQEEGGNLVRYNNKVRINFFFETERERWGELSDYEVRAASHILENKREVGAWNN
jgi:hypothetical protein